MKHWDASYYDKSSIMQFKIALDLLENFSFEGNETVLDIGSGNGRLTEVIAKRVPQGRVIGIDLSEEMVEFAHKNYQAKNLHFIKSDVVTMEYQEQFDVVVSFWTLSWVNQQASALKNIVKSLKENGRMLLMYPMRHDVYDVIDNMIKRSPWNEYSLDTMQPRPFISEEKYRQLLKDLLGNLFVEKMKLEYLFKDRNEMMLSIQSWCPYIDKFQNENERKFFIEELIDNHLSFKNRNVYSMDFNILKISGVKPLNFSY